MGVPAFFRWLTTVYPDILKEAVEANSSNDEPVDATQPNPNGSEMDCLYLDMNGIIHPCSHPEDKPAPKTEEDMFEAIFEYIDRIFNLVRPRKLLFMAIDGVAPRAKMNQQRSRRFRSAREAKENAASKAQQIREQVEQGRMTEKEAEEAIEASGWDSNVITPGTAFMDNLAKALRNYVMTRQKNDVAWHGINVVLSDASVPGEGEHKIMDYIRRQRAQPTYDAKMHHVLYGLDADLIMLGLATHETQFTILRERVDFGRKPAPKPDKMVGTGKIGQFNERDAHSARKPYDLLSLHALRCSLEKELRVSMLDWDLERAIDDWVFICYFVGNDFIPHLPTLSIREGALTKLVNAYKSTLKSRDDYLTYAGEVNLKKLAVLLHDVGELEDEVFALRHDQEENRRERDRIREAERKDRKRKAQAQGPGGKKQVLPELFVKLGGSNGPSTVVKADGTTAGSADANTAAAAALKAQMMGGEQALTPAAAAAAAAAAAQAAASAAATPVGTEAPAAPAEGDDGEPEDLVRFHEKGWKERYYKEKFNVLLDTAEGAKLRRRLCLTYLEGLCWVFAYYYKGCASWTWYFPFHYAPFASDFGQVFKGMQDVTIEFEMGTPFKPLAQLLAVFPPSSAHAIPEPYAALMRRPDLADFYDEEFVIDRNGKKFDWQGVALLDFIDEKLLLDAIASVEDQLTPDEVRRNTQGDDFVFVRVAGERMAKLQALLESKERVYDEACHGDIAAVDEADERAAADGDGDEEDGDGADTSVLRRMKAYTTAGVFVFRYWMPDYPEGFTFETKVLPNALRPQRIQVRINDPGRAFGGGHSRRNYHGQNYTDMHMRERQLQMRLQGGPRNNRGGGGGGARGGYNNNQPRGGYNNQQQQHGRPGYPPQPGQHPGFPPQPHGFPPQPYAQPGYPPQQAPNLYGAPNAPPVYQNYYAGQAAHNPTYGNQQLPYAAQGYVNRSNMSYGYHQPHGQHAPQQYPPQPHGQYPPQPHHGQPAPAPAQPEKPKAFSHAAAASQGQPGSGAKTSLGDFMAQLRNKK